MEWLSSPWLPCLFPTFVIFACNRKESLNTWPLTHGGLCFPRKHRHGLFSLPFQGQMALSSLQLLTGSL